MVVSCTGVTATEQGGLDDYYILLQCLREFYDLRKGVPRITITANCAAVVVRSAATPAPATQANSQGARNTSTNIHLSNMPQERADMEAAGNWSMTIIERWPCRSEHNRCKNKGRSCWIMGGRDEDAMNHYPIYGEALFAWSVGIDCGELTIDDPGSRIGALLVMNKYKRKEERTPSLAKQEYYEIGGTVFNVSLASNTPLRKRRARSVPPSSSPARILSPVPSVDSIDLLRAFFD